MFLVKSDDLDELVDLPDAVAVGAELPELEAHLALGLGAVRAHTRGVVVTACKYFDNDNIVGCGDNFHLTDDAGGPEPPLRVL